MRSVKAVCGIAVMALFLSGCGGGSQSASNPASASTSSAPATSSSASTSSGTSSTGSGGTGSTSGSGSTGSATLSWTAPTTNSNGTALTDLAGFHIHYGTAAGALSNVITVSSASSVSYTVTGLTSGTWYFAISAYTNTGLESTLSNVGQKTIT